MREPFTDAKFEVISGPTPVRWQKPRPGAGYTMRNNPLSWILWTILVVTALFTAFALSGAPETPKSPEPAAVVIPDGAIAIPPVEPAR